VGNLQRNAELARSIIRAAIPALSRERTCECAHALRDAIVTQRERMPERLAEELEPLIGKYVKEDC
jgi:5'-methylthioadenosine phosphorylase